MVLTYLAKMLSMSAKYELILKITYYFKVCFKFFSFILTVGVIVSIKTLIVRASQTDLNNKNPAQCSSRLGRYHGMDQGRELEFADRIYENF